MARPRRRTRRLAPKTPSQLPDCHRSGLRRRGTATGETPGYRRYKRVQTIGGAAVVVVRVVREGSIPGGGVGEVTSDRARRGRRPEPSAGFRWVRAPGVDLGTSHCCRPGTETRVRRAGRRRRGHVGGSGGARLGPRLAESAPCLLLHRLDFVTWLLMRGITLTSRRCSLRTEVIGHGLHRNAPGAFTRPVRGHVVWARGRSPVPPSGQIPHAAWLTTGRKAI